MFVVDELTGEVVALHSLSSQQCQRSDHATLLNSVPEDQARAPMMYPGPSPQPPSSQNSD